MAVADVDGVELVYELDEGGPGASGTMVLVSGLGQHLVDWPDDLCDLLRQAGFRLLRFDNRDSGLSTKVDAPAPDLDVARRGAGVRAPYELEDMAADVVGLLDVLALDRVHLVGTSLGGMVAQLIAIGHPERVQSLASISSTTGDPAVGAARPDVLELLARPRPADRDEAIDAMVATSSTWASRALGATDAHVRSRVLRRFARLDAAAAGLVPAAAAFAGGGGSARQLAAVAAARDRTQALGGLAVPVVVIHGAADPLIDVSGGRATALAVPGSRLVVIPEMAHDLPPGACGAIAGAVIDNARRTSSDPRHQDFARLR